MTLIRSLAVVTVTVVVLGPLGGCNAKKKQSAGDPPPVVDNSPTARLVAAARAVNAAPDRPAPSVYRVNFQTSKGDFVLEVHRDWAPRAADRFHTLVGSGFFDETRFFRAIDNFMVQFGIHGDPRVADAWRDTRIEDDPVKQSNRRGTITFAMGGPNTRTTQVFINFKDNPQLDPMGFAPFGEVVSGMGSVDALHTGYGEGAPEGRGPNQMLIHAQGNAYLRREFPLLDYIKSARLQD